MQPVLNVLGLAHSEFLPADAQTAFSQIEAPPGIDWVGTPAWSTAYVSGLRAIAVARAEARRARASRDNPQQFNEQWANLYLRPRTPEGEENFAYMGIDALRTLVEPAMPALERAAGKVRLANTALLTPAERLPSTQWAYTDEDRTGVSANDELRWFSVSPPRSSEQTKLGRRPVLPDALLVGVPIVNDKTKIAGDWLAMQGVGRGERSPHVLWVTDQQRRVDDALHPNRTLQRCLPGGTAVTTVEEGHDEPVDTTGDVVVVMADSLEAAMQPRQGANGEELPPHIMPEDFDIVVFYEAAGLLAGQKLAVVRRFDACKKLLLTASPSLGVRKDLRRLMHYISPLAGAEALTSDTIAIQLGVPPTLVELAARSLGIVIEEKTAVPGAKAGYRYSGEQIASITAWIEAIPVASDTVTFYSELTREYGKFVPTYFGKHGIQVQTCRHPYDSDMNGIGPYVDITAARDMKQEHARIKDLMETHRSIQEMERRTGLTKETIMRNMTAEERKLFNNPDTLFTQHGSTKPARHLPNAVADALEARVTDQLLGPDEVTRKAVASWLGISEARVVQLAADAQLGRKRVGPRNSKVAVCHIGMLRPIAEFYRGGGGRALPQGFLERLDSIQYELLPRQGEPTTPEQLEYARHVQLKVLGISEKILRPVVELPAAEEIVAEPVDEPPPEEPVDGLRIEAVAEPSEETADEPIAIAAETAADEVTGVASEPQARVVLTRFVARVRAARVTAQAEASPPPPPPAIPAEESAPAGDIIPIEEIMEAANRSAAAVENTIRQLDLGHLVRNAHLPRTEAIQIVKVLRGGKHGAAGQHVRFRSDPPELAPPPPAAPPPTTPLQVTPPKAGEETPPQPPTTEPEVDELGWNFLEDVLAEEGWTFAAFARLELADHVPGARLRREENVIQVHDDFIQRLRHYVKHKVRSFDSTGWMSHERLAQNMGLEPNELMPYLHSKDIRTGEGDARLQPSRTGRIRLEVMYCERFWRKAMKTMVTKRRQG